MPIKLTGEAKRAYERAHYKVIRERGQAGQFPCVDCGRNAWEWSFTGGDYENVENYEPRCSRCHHRYDGLNVGEKNANTGLKEADILIIRDRRYTTKELADRFGINSDAIRKIRRGETWSHVPNKEDVADGD